MKPKTSLCCLPSLSQTMAKPEGPPSVACTSHTDPLIRQGVCLMQRCGLQNTRHISRIPKLQAFLCCCFTSCPTKPIGCLLGHFSPIAIVYYCLLIEDAARTANLPTSPKLHQLLARLYTAAETQNYWCQIITHTHNNNRGEHPILHHNQQG